MGWKELDENVFVLSGSPNTGMVVTNSIALVVDPGHGDGRAKGIHNKIDSLNASARFALLTHGHIDHIAECRGFDRVFTHRWEVGLAENATIRNALEFNVLSTKGFKFISGDSVHVTGAFWWGDDVLGIEAVDTHGHTPGHTAFRYKNYIFAGDAIFGDQLIKKVKILFHTDVFEALETLKRLNGKIKDDTVLIPGHGPIVEGEKARELIELNIEAINRTIQDLWNVMDEGGTLEEITIRLMEYYGLKTEPEFVLLDMTPIRSILSKWHEEGKVEVKTEKRGLVWAKKTDKKG
ncbi:MAG: hypothetical protein PWP76_190 [Candidatus Diapherotrites archaeon]|nr:hypothetical protein [Candidatus Diapherotrites archaeon]